MTKHEKNRPVGKLHTNNTQRLVVLLASACTGVIALYFSILAIGNAASLVMYVIFFCCLMAPFITTRHISKWYTVLTITTAALALNILMVESWRTVASDFIVPFCVFYLLVTVGQTIYRRKASSFKPIPRSFVLITQSLMQVKSTSIITACLAIAIFILSPQHYSLTALLAVCFTLYAWKVAPTKQAFKLVRLFVMWLLFAFFVYAVKSYIANLSYGCSSFFGGRVTCFSSHDISYLAAEGVGFLLVLTVIIGITLSLYIKANKSKSFAQLIISWPAVIALLLFVLVLMWSKLLFMNRVPLHIILHPFSP